MDFRERGTLSRRVLHEQTEGSLRLFSDHSCIFSFLHPQPILLDKWEPPQVESDQRGERPYVWGEHCSDGGDTNQGPRNDCLLRLYSCPLLTRHYDNTRPTRYPKGEPAIMWTTAFDRLFKFIFPRQSQHRQRMDRIEKVIYVDTLQSQSAVQSMLAPYGEM